MTELREFQDGELIAGTRYRVLRLIGVGGMGSVYEVEHTELGKRFVLKALLRELARREDLVQRLRNEWRALARLQHASIVNVTDAGTSSGGVPFYVMERLDGATLAALLKQKRRLHVLEAVSIVASVLDALSAAHDIGIIHRDVKPANIFMVSGGGVKLLDFGVAKIADANGVVTARGLAVGTPRYMSPEQARGERVDGRSDVYASGLILFELIAGVGPFDDARDANELLLAHLAREAPSLSSMVMGVSPELEQILMAMLAKDCRARPAHAREVARQLREFSARHQPAPSTDVPTVQAAYAAQTAVPGRAQSSLNQQHTPRPDTALAGAQREDFSLSDAALTQPRALQQTTQVTVSVNTGPSFSVSAAPNTTLISPPSFDGSTTLHMSIPVERTDRTELLGAVTPHALVDSVVTRTHVPAADFARPPSVTPPPVVDTGRPAPEAAPRGQRLGRVLGLLAAALLVLLLAGTLLKRGAEHAAVTEPRAAAAAATWVAPSDPAPNFAPQPGAASAQPSVALALAAAADSAAPPLASAPPVVTAAPPVVTAAPNLRAFTDTKRFFVATHTKLPLDAAAPRGVFLRAIPARPVVAPAQAARPEAAMPASGL